MLAGPGAFGAPYTSYRCERNPWNRADIDVPIFAVRTLIDHVAPWRSVYKIVPLTDVEVTFLLTSGGHNAGVVSPPGTPGRSYQIAVQPHDAAYVDPDAWQAGTAQHIGSWWPAWEDWLARRAGPQVAPPPVIGLAPAPGTYVLAS